MDFVLTDDHAAMQQALRGVLASRSPLAVDPDGGHVVDRTLWAELGAMGVFDASGLGLTEAVIVFEELGRAAVPGPVVPTLLASGVIDGAAQGTTVVGCTTASTPALVEHLTDLDVLLVDRGSRVESVTDLPAGRVAAEPLDPLTPVWRVERLPDAPSVEMPASWRSTGGLLGAAFQIGLGQTALDLVVGHALHRRQFGRAIGSFQAVKHLLADAAMSVEVARAAVHAAAVTVDEGGPSTRLVAGARVVASAAADRACRAGIQVHGGLGFTWDLDAHRLLKRSWVLDAAFGGVDAALLEVAGTL